MEICCKNWHPLCLISTELGEKLWEEKIMEIFRNTKCEICAENKKNKRKLDIQKEAIERFILYFEAYIKGKIHVEEQNGKIVARFIKNGEKFGVVIID